MVSCDSPRAMINKGPGDNRTMRDGGENRGVSQVEGARTSGVCSEAGELG